jgi:hypothetical protein
MSTKIQVKKLPRAVWRGDEEGYTHPLEQFDDLGYITVSCPHCGGNEQDMEIDASGETTCGECKGEYRYVPYC